MEKQRDDVCNGITPARAGKTLRVKHCEDMPEDHPRACGENIFHLMMILFR